MTLVKYPGIPALLETWLTNNEPDFLTKRNFSETTLPAVNIKETEESFEVELAAPGFQKSDFKIEVENNVLTISSEKQEENELKEGETFTKREFSYQAFTRSFTLPETVESDKITAKYDNGILKIEIPKKDEAKPKPVKQIQVS